MTETPDRLIADTADLLHRAKRAVEAEIARYPRPVSGCDTTGQPPARPAPDRA